MSLLQEVTDSLFTAHADSITTTDSVVTAVAGGFSSAVADSLGADTLSASLLSQGEATAELLPVGLPFDAYHAADSLLHPEVSEGRYGVTGDPIPYTIRTDNAMTLLLLFCAVLFVVSVGRSRRFIVRQLKEFFLLPREDNSFTETSGELRFQLFLVLQSSLLLSIIGYSMITHYVADTFVLDADVQLVGILFALFLSFFLLRTLLYSVVNLVFFDARRNLQWLRALLFLQAIEGVLLFPAVLLQVYFDLSAENVLYYFVFVLFLTKIFTIYKVWAIFFRRNGLFLQIILYFCTLEVVPLLLFGGAMLEIVDLLTINF